MYVPPSTGVAGGADGQKKRRPQVKLACMNCRRQHAGCTDIRPCERCTRLGLADTCEDMPRKKRSKKKDQLRLEEELDAEDFNDDGTNALIRSLLPLSLFYQGHCQTTGVLRATSPLFGDFCFLASLALSKLPSLWPSQRIFPAIARIMRNSWLAHCAFHPRHTPKTGDHACKPAFLAVFGAQPKKKNQNLLFPSGFEFLLFLPTSSYYRLSPR